MNIADEYVCNRKEDNMEFNYSYRLIKSDYRGTPVYGEKGLYRDKKY